jgi:hypothetical protein
MITVITVFDGGYKRCEGYRPHLKCSILSRRQTKKSPATGQKSGTQLEGPLLWGPFFPEHISINDCKIRQQTQHRFNGLQVVSEIEYPNSHAYAVMREP